MIPGHSLQILRSPHSYHTRLVAFQVSGVWFRLVPFAALSDRHRLRVRVCCCSGGWFRCCPACAACSGSFPLHVFCPQLLCSCCRTFLRVSCCCCSVNNMRTLIPARPRMLQKTLAIFLRRGRTRRTWCCCSKSQTLVLPSPH